MWIFKYWLIEYSGVYIAPRLEAYGNSIGYVELTVGVLLLASVALTHMSFARPIRVHPRTVWFLKSLNDMKLLSNI